MVMTYKVKQSKIVKEFRCLGSECSNNCCGNWQMQLDDKRADLYMQNPELSDSICKNNNQFMMKHDENKFCVKLENGLCSVHAKYGADMLGDACYFYPRIARRIGDEVIISATLSCPEITRLMLEDEKLYNKEDAIIERMPLICKDYLPKELNKDQAFNIHNHIINYLDNSQDFTANELLSHLISFSKSLDMIEKESWEEAIPFLLENVSGRIIAPQKLDIDPFNIINALMLVMHASRIKNHLLIEILSQIASSLRVSIDLENLSINCDQLSSELYNDLIKFDADDMLKKYLYAQISSNFFPFAGLGKDVSSKISSISLKFATIRLALACHDKKDSVKVIHAISRLYDHLESDDLLVSLFRDFNWFNESRLLGLVLT